MSASQRKAGDKEGEGKPLASRRRFLTAAGAGAGAAAVGLVGLDASPASAAPSPGASPSARADAAVVGTPRAGAPAAHGRTAAARTVYTLPSLVFGKAATQDRIGTLYESALTDVVGINTIYADPSVYDKAGLVSYPPGTLVRAGGGYPEPQRWTRDAAINAWSGVSLLGPLVGRNTLWSVVDAGTGSDGPIVQQDNEWWDQIVWVVGAWNHYLVTGDRDFLTTAYGVSVSTLAARKSQNFNAAKGLFQGPGYMNDGIAGYPSPPWQAGVNSSFVLDYPHADELMCLSTNCLYHGAYLALEGMASALGHKAAASGHRTAAAALGKAVNRHLWREDAGTYAYFVHGEDQLAGQVDTSQEGAGLALAVLFGVADERQTRLLLDNAHWQPHGIVNVWPHFPLFDDDHPGRHNVMVWPMVHSLFGHAAALGGRTDLFGRALDDLADLVSGSENGFYELYNSRTGAVDGGWQTGGDGTLGHNDSQPDQAWSATGYLRLVHHGLFGLTFSTSGLRLAPSLPAGYGPAALYGLAYRDMTLDIELTGAGNRVRSCTIDGRKDSPLLSEAVHGGGHHVVSLTLEGA